MDDHSLQGKYVWQLRIGAVDNNETLLFSSEKEAKQYARESLVRFTKDEITDLIKERNRLENQIKNLEELVERVETTKDDNEEKALQDMFRYECFIFLVPIR